MSFNVELSYGSSVVFEPRFADDGETLVGFEVAWADGSPVSDAIRRNLLAHTIHRNRLTMNIIPEHSVTYRKVKSGAVLPKVIIGNAECTLTALKITMERGRPPTGCSIDGFLLKDGVRDPRSLALPIDKILSRINLVDFIRG
jgi:hypothetical protein